MTEPQIALDLTLALKEHHRGQVTMIQTWLLDESKQPCLVLVPTYAYRTRDRIIPCIVTLGMAWQWDEATGDPVYAFDKSKEFARALGFNDNDPQTVFAITSMIQEMLGELVMQMPLDRWVKQQEVAHLVINDGSGPREVGVKDYVH